MTEMDCVDANVYTMSLTITNLEVLGHVRWLFMFAFILCNTSYLSFELGKEEPHLSIVND
jgi:hypothetical protein